MSAEPTEPTTIPDLEQIPAIASATMISGPTGSGKTSLIATFAEYVWERFHKTTLYYSCDAGGFTERLQALVALGIVRAFRMRTRGEAFETAHRSTQGWWPAEINPLTGEVPQNVEMIPPVIQEFTMACPKDGTVVRRVPVQSLLLPVVCAACKQMVNNLNGVFYKTMRPSPTFHPAGMPEVGAVAYDGLTSMGDWLMNDMADRTARGDLVGEKTALGGKIRSGAMDFGSNNRAHYGFAQTMVEKLIINTISIPGLMAPPLWTALEGRVDPETGMDLPEYGPLIPGQAKTRKVPQWVGNYLGAVQVTGKDGKKSWRLYTVEYRGEDNVPHKYKIRSDPGGIREYYEDAEGEAPFTTFNLGRLFSDLEASFGTTYAKLKAKYADAPGVGKAGPQVNLEAVDAPNTLTYASGPSDGGTTNAAVGRTTPATPTPTGPARGVAGAGAASAGAPGRGAGAPVPARAVARPSAGGAGGGTVATGPQMVKPGGGGDAAKTDAAFESIQRTHASGEVLAPAGAEAAGPAGSVGAAGAVRGADSAARAQPVAGGARPASTPTARPSNAGTATVGARVLPPKPPGTSSGSGGADRGGSDSAPDGAGGRQAGVPGAGVPPAEGGVRAAEAVDARDAAGGDGGDAVASGGGGDGGAAPSKAKAPSQARAASSKVPGAPPAAPRPPQAAPVKGPKDARGRG